MNPNQPAAGHLPQPNLGNLVGGLQAVTHELSFVPNMPIVQGQQDILAAIQALNNRFDRLENRQANFEISAINATIFSKDFEAPLQPLRNVYTGVEIPNFPPTLPDLKTTHEGIMDAILIELGIHLAAGTALAVKKETIRKKWVG